MVYQLVDHQLVCHVEIFPGRTRLQRKIDACDNSWMALQEVISPEVEIPILDGIIETCGHIYVLVKLPGMDGSYHGGNGVAVPQVNGIGEVLVIGIGTACSLVDDPPCICTPEQVAVIGDGTIHVESRSEVRELHAAVQVKGRNYFCAHVIPLADRQAIANQSAPIGTVLTCLQVNTCGKVVAQSILEGGVRLLLIDAGTYLDGSVAI